LTASLTVLAGDAQQPVHGGDRAQVDAVVEEPSPDLGGREVAELVGPQHRQDVLTFGLAQRVAR